MLPAINCLCKSMNVKLREEYNVNFSQIKVCEFNFHKDEELVIVMIDNTDFIPCKMKNNGFIHFLIENKNEAIIVFTTSTDIDFERIPKDKLEMFLSKISEKFRRNILMLRIKEGKGADCHFHFN